MICILSLDNGKQDFIMQFNVLAKFISKVYNPNYQKWI